MNQDLVIAITTIVLALAANSPSIWLLCIASRASHRVVAVLLLGLSLLGYMGLDAMRLATTCQG